MNRRDVCSTTRGNALFVVCAVLAVVALLAGVAFALGWFRSAPKLSGDGRDVAEPFLAAVRAGKVDVAWESTTADFKSYRGREAFRQFVRQRPALKQPSEFSGFTPATDGDSPSWNECTFQTKAVSGTRLKPATIRLR